MADFKTFEDLALDALVPTASRLKNEGWRCVQMLCVNTEEGVDLTYSFSKDATLANYQVRGVGKDDVVPSIQGLFLGVFPFENEAVDLFGVNIEGMTLDFAGQFYAVSEREPMTILTPEAKERKDKEAKKAAAAAKASISDSNDENKAPKASAEDIEAKLAGMDPEKAAKVRAAMEAKALKDAAQAAGQEPADKKPRGLTEEEIEAKIAGLDPEKAAKVRAALLARAQKNAKKGDE